VTGHTGFKGSWLALWLRELGAEVTGLALAPDTSPSLFDVAGIASGCNDLRGDVRDRDAVRGAVREARPDVVFHLAAQALVRGATPSPSRPSPPT
jgi:CDP-glucose 4,6-dehydratase